jgi:hypothetical protein
MLNHGNISCHLPYPLTDRLSPIDFAGMMVMGNLRHEILKTVPPAGFHGWCYGDNAVSYLNFHLIPDSKPGVFHHILCKTLSLAITPFLDFCKHVTASLCISDV